MAVQSAALLVALGACGASDPVTPQPPPTACAADRPCPDGRACRLETGTCPSSCATEADCQAGYWCVQAADASSERLAGSCRPLEDLGSACARAASCGSGHCIDGVCCISACSATCQACARRLTGRADGDCVSVLDGVDDADDCPGHLSCDGRGGCWLGVLGTSCQRPDQCLSGFCRDGVCCDGFCYQECHSCAQPGSLGSCLPVRNGLDPDTCYLPMACNSWAACKAATADYCLYDHECASGACVHQRCCERACDGLCEDCDNDGLCKPVTVGTDWLRRCPTCHVCSASQTCVPAAVYTDPRRECGFCHSCDATQQCTPTPLGLDARSDCPAWPVETCENAGTGCDGTGWCRRYPQGTVCGPDDCSTDLDGVWQRRCDNWGNCQSTNYLDCAPLQCTDEGATDQCRDTCINVVGAARVSIGCQEGWYCENNTVCGGTPCCMQQLINGLLCNFSFECLSGFCVDRRCCEDACTEAGHSCAVSGHSGQCWPE